MSAAGARASTRCAARTTCRAAATWARCPIGCRASSTSRTTRCARSSIARGASRCRRERAGTCRRCSKPWSGGELRALYVIGENPVQSEADQHRATHLLEGLDCLIVQDLFLTGTARDRRRRAAGRRRGVRSEGTVTSSERRVQRVRRTKQPEGESRDDLAIIFDLAKKLGHDWGPPDAERVWNELRTLSPVHAGMSYAAPRSARRHAVAVLRRAASRRSVSAQPAVGAARRRPARALHAGRASPARGQARRRVPVPADHRTPAGRVQHRRADRRVRVANPTRRDASTSRPRTPTRLQLDEGQIGARALASRQVVVPVHVDDRCGRV